MDTPIEESNLAHIGSDEDKAAREGAAKLEHSWDGAGQEVGVQVWRVENKRTEDGDADFGIAECPMGQSAEFYRGDSYIVLRTLKDGDALCWDIFFWIGSESTQDEYGVAAYKAVELDDLLGDAPVQYREVEGNESEQFLSCFTEVKYHDGGIDSGFRDVDVNEKIETLPARLFRVVKKGRQTLSFQVKLSCDSLNQGDVFLLDAGTTVYTWFGNSCSPFEKSKSGTMAANMSGTRHGHCEVVNDVNDENENFWSLLGGKEEIRDEEPPVVDSAVTQMYVLDTVDSFIRMKQVELSRDNLASGAVYLVDAGSEFFVWIGKESSVGEKQQAMLLVNKNLKAMGRQNDVRVAQVKEGQTRDIQRFDKLFS